MRTYSKAPPQQSKTCSSCRLTKDASEFYKTDTGRLRHLCKECYSDHNREQRIKHHQKRSEYARATGTKWTPESREKYKLPKDEQFFAYAERSYGVSRQRYEEMWAAQGGVCAICRRECNRSNSDRLCIDHDHGTGQVRGLLCFKCNVGLGRFDDDVLLMESAIDYIRGARDRAAGLPAVFISGPMSGLPRFNYPAFHKAARILRSLGHRVENPAENKALEGAKWKDFMRMSIRQLVTCERILMLPGWEKSKGARLERHIAMELGMEEVFLMAEAA